MESVLVWLWVDGHQPYHQSARGRMKEAKRAIREEKTIQLIEWMKYEAQKPDLKLIREVRKAEQERVGTVGENIRI